MTPGAGREMGRDPSRLWTGQRWTVWKAGRLLGLAGGTQEDFSQKGNLAPVQGPPACSARPARREERGSDLLPLREPHRLIRAGQQGLREPAGPGETFFNSGPEAVQGPRAQGATRSTEREGDEDIFAPIQCISQTDQRVAK